MVLMVDISKSLTVSRSGKTLILKDQALIRIGLLGQNSTFFVIRSLENLVFYCYDQPLTKPVMSSLYDPT